MYDLLLFLHFVGIALGVGTGFAFLALGIGTRDMAIPDRGAFMLRAFILGRNGSIGIVLLILTGIGMVMLRGGFAAVTTEAGMAFNIKLVLVVVLVGLIGYMEAQVKKAKRDKGGPVMLKIAKMGPVILLTALATVACAVLAFH